MNVLGRIFLNSCKDRQKTERRKDGVFSMRCKRTYVLKNTLGINFWSQKNPNTKSNSDVLLCRQAK